MCVFERERFILRNCLTQLRGWWVWWNPGWVWNIQFWSPSGGRILCRTFGIFIRGLMKGCIPATSWRERPALLISYWAKCYFHVRKIPSQWHPTPHWLTLLINWGLEVQRHRLRKDGARGRTWAWLLGPKPPAPFYSASPWLIQE